MTISVGENLPEVNLLQIGAGGPEPVALKDLTSGRKVVIAGVPGAYTPTCHAQHIPDFIARAKELRGKGVDHVIFISVNDPFVMQHWGRDTGADSAGILMLSDAASDLTRALGLEFSAPGAGLFDRCQRFALLAEDGKVAAINVQEPGGDWAVAGAAPILAALSL